MGLFLLGFAVHANYGNPASTLDGDLHSVSMSTVEYALLYSKHRQRFSWNTGGLCSKQVGYKSGVKAPTATSFRYSSTL